MDALVISFLGKTYKLAKGESKTFKCAGQPVTTDFSITYNSVGYFTNNGITKVGQAGTSFKLRCAGKIMPTNIVIEAREYGSDSALPPEVSTAEGMNSLLVNATSASVGEIYKYTGTSTDTYENGALYIIT